MPITVISVSKSYSNRGNHRHRQGTKKHWHVYFFDHGDGKFKSRRISALEALYYRTQRRHKYRFACPECGGTAIAFVKSLTEEVDCPYCSYRLSLEELDDESVEGADED